MEQRSAPRVRTVLKAEIRYNDGLMHMPCLIRDLSETGARLDLSADVPIPDRFDLFIEKKHQTRRAVVKRRRGRDVGVAFDDETARRAQSEAGLSERVAKLESDLAEIRRLLELLTVAIQSSRHIDGASAKRQDG